MHQLTSNEPCLVHVTKIRRKKGYVSAKRVDDFGITRDSYRPLSVYFPEQYNDAVRVGSLWRVTGDVDQNTFTADNGRRVIEDRVNATNVELVIPSTTLLKYWFKENIKGVGDTRADAMSKIENLEALIAHQDRDGLIAAGINKAWVDKIIANFPTGAYRDAIDLLGASNIPVRIAHAISSVWKEETIDLIKDFPWRLEAFGVSYAQCNRLAKDFGYTPKDTKWKAARVSNILNRYSEKSASSGSTVMPVRDFVAACPKDQKPEDLIAAAFEFEVMTYLKSVEAFQLKGPFLLETTVGDRLRDAIFRAPGEGSELAGWERNLNDDEINHHLGEFEATKPFSLTDEQRDAIRRSCRMNVICLSGGAGTGKTTILEGILWVLERASLGVQIYQLALSGRAAQRMNEATGRKDASTIAKFCIDQSKMDEDDIPDHCVVVIDEASMVDLVSMNNLIDRLPYATRYLFVGDVHQLPPVGGGLVFHELMNSDFPKVELTRVQRQGEESGIHRFATAVRHQEENITLPLYEEGADVDCSLVKSVDPEVISRIFEAHGGSRRGAILASMKKGDAGVHELNTFMQRKLGTDREPLVCVEAGEDLPTHWKTLGSKGNYLYLGDPILITKNDYKVGVRNGDIGTITSVYGEADANGSFGKLTIGDQEIEIDKYLVDKMDHGFAMTIHKSQGSQWENVILVLDGEADHMLDKTLLYTGATRAQRKLIICCEDMATIQKAVDRGSIALQRRTNLLTHLNMDAEG